MLLGRNVELQNLEEKYQGHKNTLTVLYGRTGIGKTALLKAFVQGKQCFCYCAPQASDQEQLAIMKRQLQMQIQRQRQGIAGEQREEQRFSEASEEQFFSQADYEAVLSSLIERVGIRLIVLEEFQNIVKTNASFMDAVTSVMRKEYEGSPLMIVFTSSSISWIENSLVSAIGSNAYTITAFMKLKELTFVDTVRMFPNYSVADSLRVYAITGGVPGYMVHFTDKRSLKENICRNILRDGAPLREEGSAFVRGELRETSLYNTILYCIAGGEHKLNELHEHTGFGRDKISVYLKNLMEREIVEKVFSFDTLGNEYTRKGLYGIRAGFVEFWFRYLYANESELFCMTAEAFYDQYIAETLDDFASAAFNKIGTEYIELLNTMGKLQIEIDRRGCWWGKNGNIDLIACDTQGHYVVGKCNWTSELFTFTMFEELMYNVNLAGIGRDYIYLFSKGSFDEELTAFAKENDNVILVGIEDL